MVSLNMIYNGEKHTLNTVFKWDISEEGNSYVYNLSDMIQQYNLPYSGNTTIEFEFAGWTSIGGIQGGPRYYTDSKKFSFLQFSSIVT